MTASASVVPATSATDVPGPRPAPICGSDHVPNTNAAADQVDLRQLRHMTNNALQAILREISQHQELQHIDVDRLIRSNLERRILLVAAIADSLFGLTRETGPMAERLRGMGQAVVALLGEPGQAIDIQVSAIGHCPARLESMVLRVAHELLGNAVKHGMQGRVIGCISVQFISDESHTVLTITDDGWGCGDEPGQGEGLRLSQLLADEHGGHVRLECSGRSTIATLDVPHTRQQPGWASEHRVYC